MKEIPNRWAARAPKLLAIVLIAALSLAVRIYLIESAPALYSWDAFTRLFDPSRLFVRHWLPLPQLPIIALSALGASIFQIRLFYAAIGTACALMCGYHVGRRSDFGTGCSTAMLVSFLPLFLKFTIVPYQEALAILCLVGFLQVSSATRLSAPRTFAAGALLLAAGTCRYEIWGFACLVGVGALVRRQYRRLWQLAPLVLFAGVWIATLPYRETPSPITAVADQHGMLDLIGLALQSVSGTVLQLADDMLWVGLPLALFGAYGRFRVGGILGREVLLLWFASIAMVILRDVNVRGLTDRMTLLPAILGSLYLAFGLRDLALRAGPRVGRWLPVAATAILCLVYLPKSYALVVECASFFAPEAAAARALERAADLATDDDRVVIVPRVIPNRFQENAVKAIFANSSRLRPDDPRWIYERQGVQEHWSTADYLLLFNYARNRYDLIPRDALPPGVANRPPRVPDFY